MQHPQAANRVVTGFYVDDFLDLVDTESEGHLTKWTSTSETVLQDIAPEDRCDETRDLDLGNEAQWKKTLGVHWCAQDDQFRFKVKAIRGENTKRSILSSASAVFDPLGMLVHHPF
ncbi:uncharacterized protein LOC119089283 [Pollicipes pollicipes]|uniref:uncharacterized protein LOC119089283 n=1 Tax=Pollicipes pollicipes TaxID=41117 RepID=UPI001884B9AD|nr:uncharacterized protein LOC119089283 [Pollicipes pollicipes]